MDHWSRRLRTDRRSGFSRAERLVWRPSRCIRGRDLFALKVPLVDCRVTLPTRLPFGEREHDGHGAAPRRLDGALGDRGGAAALELAAKHDSRHWNECRRCRLAYQRAMKHTLERLPRASFPAKMIMGWTLLADERHPKELRASSARRWASSTRTAPHVG